MFRLRLGPSNMNDVDGVVCQRVHKSIRDLNDSATAGMLIKYESVWAGVIMLLENCEL